MNEKCDVFSFGVLLLEVIIGKHPGDLISFLSAFSPSTPSTGRGILLKDVLDQRLSSPRGRAAGEVVFFVKLAFSCLSINPQSRPTMRSVSQGLSAPKAPLSKMFDKICLSELVDSAA